MKQRDFQLEKGHLYQVRHWQKGWIIAEYRTFAPAHIAHGYRSTDGKREWKEPASHYWQTIRGEMFIVRDKDLQVRPCTQDALREITRIKELIASRWHDYEMAKKSLWEFCE